MRDIFAAKFDDFLVAMYGSVIVFSAILAEETLHQPCFGEVGRNVQNPIKKNLRHFPAFFRNSSSGVPPINANNRVLGLSTKWSRIEGGFNIDVHVQKHNER